MPRWTDVAEPASPACAGQRDGPIVKRARLATRAGWPIQRRMRTLMRTILAGLCLALPLMLAGCGDLPEPFLGNPGATGRRLAQPPTPRLAVPPPPDMLLPDAASKTYADALASALQQNEVPAIAQASQRTDWTLLAKAQQQNGMVVPKFVVRDPQGKEEGSVDGAPVPAAAWAAGDPATLQRSAAEAAPKIATMLGNVQIALMKADPNSLYNRPAKVMVAQVTGAPGDGDEALTREMRKRLAALGPIVQTTPDGADYIVQGRVRVVPIENRQERVEIQWIVSAAPDQERGRVVQLNEIPAGTLNRYWGDVAVVVATEASQGVENVLLRQTPATAPDRTPPATSDKNAAVHGQGEGGLLEGQTANAGPGAGCPPQASEPNEDCRLQQQSSSGRGGRSQAQPAADQGVHTAVRRYGSIR